MGTIVNFDFLRKETGTVDSSIERRTTQHWNLLGNVSSNKSFKLHRPYTLNNTTQEDQSRMYYIKSIPGPPQVLTEVDF
jgi:hypothetical protein